MQRFRRAKLIGLQLVAMAALLASSLGMGVAQAATDTSTGPVAKAKAAPVAPKIASNVVTAPVASKSKSKVAAVTPALAWSVSLTASTTSLWPTQYSTLTATANQNVGPTAYYIGIYDTSTNTSVAICGTGTVCTASVTHATATTHDYRAYVAYYSTTNPPTGIQASSNYVTVNWRSISVSLAASPPTLAVGGTTTLTATATADVAPTPFWIQIFDTNTGARIGVCGGGTVCNATTSQSVATTHKFIAYVASYGTTLPLSNVQATSNASFVTWANTGYRITSLTTTRTSIGHDTVTATSNVSMGPTPYFIEIFSLTTGSLVAECGYGTSCSADVALKPGQNNFVAFISSSSTAIPPVNTQANSNVVSDWYFIIF